MKLIAGHLLQARCSKWLWLRFQHLCWRGTAVDMREFRSAREKVCNVVLRLVFPLWCQIKRQIRIGKVARYVIDLFLFRRFNVLFIVVNEPQRRGLTSTGTKRFILALWSSYELPQHWGDLESHKNIQYLAGLLSIYNIHIYGPWVPNCVLYRRLCNFVKRNTLCFIYV